LKRYIDDPPIFEEGVSAATLLRRKPTTKRVEDRGDEDELSDSSGSGESDSDAPRKPVKKRKRRQADDSELDARREKRRLADLAKRALIKSEARIIDSDDDEDADKEFFERERELRARMAAKALEDILPQHGTKKAKKQSPRQAEVEVIGIEEEETPRSTPTMDFPIASQGTVEEDEEVVALGPKRRRIRRAISVSSEDE
jgi:replication fork protection complex subunit Tof1/Swi1